MWFNNIKNKIKLLDKNLINLLSKISYFEELNEFKNEIGFEISALTDFQNLINVNSILQNRVSQDDYTVLRVELENLLKNIKTLSEGLIGFIKTSEKDMRFKNLIKIFSKVEELNNKQNEELSKLKSAINRSKTLKLFIQNFLLLKKEKFRKFMIQSKKTLKFITIFYTHTNHMKILN